jgi:hypothetical protein
VRYCLDDYAGPGGARLWAQSQAWSTAAAPPLPPTDKCPAVTWDSSRVVAQHVTNRAGGLDRPVFAYDAAVTADVRRVDMALYVDTTPGADPKETRLESGIFLRNANRAPTAAFTATVTGSGQLILDATPSSDRENERLLYAWRVDGAAIAPTSATVDYAGLPSGPHTVELKVTDPGGLFGTALRSVDVP